MAENDFKGAMGRVAAKAAEAAQAASPEGAKSAFAALIREVAAALELLPAPAAAAVATPVEPKKTGIDVTPPNPKKEDPKVPTPAVSATGSADEEFFKKLVETHKALAGGPWPFDPDDYSFLERGLDIYKSMSEADRGGEKMTKTVGAALDRIDGLIRHAYWISADGALAKLSDVRSTGAKFLAARGGDAGQPPSKPVAGAAPAQQALFDVCGDVGSSTKIPSDRRGKIAAAVKVMAKYHDEMASADDDKRNVMLRYSLNEITPHELFLGVEPSKRILQLLTKAGINEILTPLGQLFDDSYSPSKYDRRKVASKEPRNTILQVLQRGFLNKEGVCIQKAVVAISSGE